MAVLGLFCSPAGLMGCALRESGGQGSGLVLMGQKDADFSEEPVPWH